MLTVDANVWVADQQTTEPDHMESREFLAPSKAGRCGCICRGWQWRR